jgi:two-component system, chemotaxis family, sensor kinase CheA
MVRDEELLRELLQTFQVEAVEHLQVLNQALLKLERQPDTAQQTALVQEAFRAAHSLKGAARAVALTPIEKLAHSLEDVLKVVRDGKLTLEPAICDVLYTTIDVIQRALNNESLDIGPIRRELHALIAQQDEVVQTETLPEAQITAEPIVAVSPILAETEETIRVAVSKLDALMAQTGELLIARISAAQRTLEMQQIRQQLNCIPRPWREIRTLAAKISRTSEDGQRLVEYLQRFDEQLHTLTLTLNNLDTAINRDALRLGMVTGRLQSEMRRVRMIPFSTVEGLFQRTVRDAARSERKQVELTLVGGEIELDKKVLEMLKDPFLHLLRNAVSHGIEPPAAREAAGKASNGLITISITQRGSEAQITIRDDGHGFDLETLRQSAETHNIRLNDAPTDDELIGLAFLPGITTSNGVSAISGRGVGLDIVREQIELLQGRVQVENQSGEGVTFRLSVPVSLAMTRVLLVRIGGKRYALPLSAVEKIVTPRQTFSIEAQTMLSVDGQSMPLVPLASALKLSYVALPEPLAVILGAGDQRIALLVDDVLTEQELAVKPFGKPIVRVANLSGAAVLGNGDPVVVLNVADLVKSARGVRVTHIEHLTTQRDGGENLPAECILVVDDSITTRTLEKNILEAAGYEVHTATDGVQALQQLKSQTIKLVVADVEMPNMDGITLTRYLRDSNEFKELPVILVTSLESSADRERGMMAGANAYIVKRGFNQAELLSTIQQYL